MILLRHDPHAVKPEKFKDYCLDPGKYFEHMEPRFQISIDLFKQACEFDPRQSQINIPVQRPAPRPSPPVPLVFVYTPDMESVNGIESIGVANEKEGSS